MDILISVLSFIRNIISLWLEKLVRIKKEPLEKIKETKYTVTYTTKISEHISIKEVYCKHCKKGAEKIHRVLIEFFERLKEEVQEYIGRETPIIINSGYRCPTYTRWLITQGVKTSLGSPHLYGVAFDLSIPNNLTKKEFVKLIRFVSQKYDIGIRIGWKNYTTHVHIDVAYLIPVEKRPTSKAKISWIKGVEW
jgi:uncharacterized protein YcbK (DUF882 family)